MDGNPAPKQNESDIYSKGSNALILIAVMLVVLIIITYIVNSGQPSGAINATTAKTSTITSSSSVRTTISSTTTIVPLNYIARGAQSSSTSTSLYVYLPKNYSYYLCGGSAKVSNPSGIFGAMTGFSWNASVSNLNYSSTGVSNSNVCTEYTKYNLTNAALVGVGVNASSYKLYRAAMRSNMTFTLNQSARLMIFVLSGIYNVHYGAKPYVLNIKSPTGSNCTLSDQVYIGSDPRSSAVQAIACTPAYAGMYQLNQSISNSSAAVYVFN